MTWIFGLALYLSVGICVAESCRKVSVRRRIPLTVGAWLVLLFLWCWILLAAALLREPKD